MAAQARARHGSRIPGPRGVAVELSRHCLYHPWVSVSQKKDPVAATVQVARAVLIEHEGPGGSNFDGSTGNRCQGGESAIHVLAILINNDRSIDPDRTFDDVDRGHDARSFS